MPTFIVTVTPKHKLHAGSWSSEPYETEVYAKTKAQATKRVRDQYEDRKVNPISVRARLKPTPKAD